MNRQKSSISRLTSWIVSTVMFIIIALLGFLYYPYGLGDKIKSDVLVLGHAGSGFMSPLNPFNPLPANSMASIVKAIEKDGADGVEVDVQMSQDGEFILYHDTHLESMTGKSGTVESHKAAEVIGLKYAGGFIYDLFHNEEIISLEALLQRFATYSELPVLQLDLRNYNPSRNVAYAQKLTALLRKYHYPSEKLMFISEDIAFLETFREVDPNAPLMLDSEGDFQKSLAIALDHNLDGICVESIYFTHGQIKEAQSHGLQVVLFGGKSRSRITKMINLEPDAIQVNNPEAARSLIE